MITVTAHDFRPLRPAFAAIEVQYDPADVEDFDTRGETYRMDEETWGERVEIEGIGMLYLVVHSRGNGRTLTSRNELREA